MLFGPKIFMYHVQTFRTQFSFCSSQQLVSITNEPLQYFMQISQVIFQLAQHVRRLWLLRTLFFRKNQVGSKVTSMKTTFYVIFDPTWTHMLPLKGPNKEFLKGNPNFQDILNWILHILHYYCRKQHKNIKISQIIEQNLVVSFPFSVYCDLRFLSLS